MEIDKKIADLVSNYLKEKYNYQIVDYKK